MPPRPSDYNRDGVIATGLLALGNWGGGDADKEKLLTDIVDDQIDVVSKTFLGLTVSCARCHDHKFDPISTKDYYGLAGIFFSTHILPNVGPKTNGPPMLRIPLISRDEQQRRQKHEADLKRLTAELESARRRAYADHAKAALADTAKYLLAAHDVRAGASVESVAKRDNLSPATLRRWITLLAEGNYRPLTKTFTERVAGRAGVHGWRNDAECPNALINTTAQEQAIATFRLPPKSVAIHPGPRGGVVVAWHSPVRATVKLSGRLADADPQCGDGIAWVVEHRRGGALTQLAAGRIANGGKQALPEKSVTVTPGDRLELVVLPGNGYECDTTVVELTIREVGGERAWDLARDIVASARRPATTAWHFLDAGERRGSSPPSDLAPWREAVARQSDRKALQAAAAAAAKRFARFDDTSPFWPEDERLLPAAARADLTKRRTAVEALRQVTFAPLTFANGAQEGGVPGSPHAGTHDVRVHVRGRYDRLGDVVPRRFPEVIAGAKQPAITSGSGRLELAKWLAGPNNPLPARVIVNRLWQHHFGRGIVNTPSNFGAQGERPTHPELLDWLAAELVKGEWSLKRVHRIILLSATYRQNGAGHAETVAADPDNLLVGRMSRRRLEAEAVRDALLAAGGGLDLRHGGPALRDARAPRRAMYLMTIRSESSGFGPLFDAADSTAPVEKRTVSTVAPQALYLMNSELVTAQAAALARRVVAAHDSDGERVELAYRLLYGRPPDADERRLGERFLRGDARRWADYARVLMCANEMVYVD